MHFLASSLPWDRFKKFFAVKKLVNLSANEQLILLRLVALQEILCLNDDALLRWAKHQLYLFSFMQPDFQPKLPSKQLLVEFRDAFDKIGLLKPFRRQCQKIIAEHDNRLPPINVEESVTTTSLVTSTKNETKKIAVSASKVNMQKVKSKSEVCCPNCGSKNVIKLKPEQEASSLPNIRFSRCRFCGNTFRD